MRANAFIAQLQPHADKRLVFEQDGRRIQPGYHVTEIKAASFRSLDCGARPQQWEETIVQLWDVADKPEHGHMPVRKFLGIWRKVDADVGLNGETEIKFEWGDAITPAVHYIFGGLHVESDAVVVSVEPVRATCKPRDEWWLAQRAAEGSGCCVPASPDMTDAAGTVIALTDIAPSASLGIRSTAGSCCN
jgi:hypothetical protein